MIECREAHLGDTAGVEDLLREMHAASQFEGVELDERKAHFAVEGFIARAECLTQVLISDGWVCGILIAHLAPLWWGRGDAAQDVVFYVNPNYRGHGLKLVKAYRQWAKGFDSVKMIQFNVSFGGWEAERSEKLFDTLGMSKIGSIYLERV